MGGVICNANDRKKKAEVKDDNQKIKDIDNEIIEPNDENENNEFTSPTKADSKKDSKNEDNGLSPNKVAIDTNLLVSKGTDSIKNNYRRTKILGQGSFGTVFLVKHKLLNNFFAMKVIKKVNKNEKDDVIMNEINILRKMDHPNIHRILFGGRIVL